MKKKGRKRRTKPRHNLSFISWIESKSVWLLNYRKEKKMSWKEIKTTRSYLLWPFTLHVIIVKSRICGLNEAHCAWKRLKEQQPKDQRPWNSYNTYLTSSPVLLFSAKLCKWFCTTSSIYRKRATKKKQKKNSSTEASGGDRDGAGEAKNENESLWLGLQSPFIGATAAFNLLTSI